MVAITASDLVKAAAVDSQSTVVVLGASGGVGGMVLQLLREKGCKVVACASTASFDFVRKVGGEAPQFEPRARV
jgi:NADPH:quinone reductase